MAESVVSFLIEKLAMWVEKEVKLLKGVRGEFELIIDEFQRMKAFLASAESSQEEDPELKLWVKQIMEVAYDTEDILDEFMLKLARDQGHGFMGYLRKIKLSIENVKVRRHFSSDIADIKSRVSSIGEGHRRYHFGSYRIEQSESTSTKATSWRDLREDAFLIEEGELVGIDKPREKIIKWLVDKEPELEVVSISGMGGSGKTTLAGRVYNNQQVRAHFQSHAWINVSKSYGIDDILRDMIVQLHREFQQPLPQGVGIMSRTSLKQTVKDFLQQKRYVIVMDDIWSLEALEGIKNAMPNSNFHSRIIITTRIANIATTSSNQSKVYTCEPLSQEESWSLFCKKAFQGKPCPPHLVNLSQRILEKCEGLPLAIVAIGGLLIEKDVEGWEKVSHSLAAEQESNNEMRNFWKILSLSYIDLNYNLKSCFLYLGVFPEDCVIECKRLIRLWIAEGFVDKEEGCTREEVAQRYLNELINRSLVQIVETTFEGRLKSCRVHDLLRESILPRLRDMNFVSFASKQVELPEKVRRLSVQYTSNDAPKQLNLPCLRSLLIFKSATSSSLDEQFVPSGCQPLRVLDLGDSPLQEFPKQILVLFHLKYLSLRRTRVCIIPTSIGELQNLETLDLKDTLVSELPAEITKLKKLQYLLVYKYANYTPSRPFCSVTGFLAPQGIGELALVQKLCHVKAGGDRSKDTMQELGELCQLRRLGVTDLKEDDVKELCHSLEKMTQLRSLQVHAESEYEVIDLDFLSSPPPLLHGLCIKGRLKKLPDWLHLLNNLARVSLQWSKLKLSPLLALQNLPNLVELELGNAFNGEDLTFEDGKFPKLKKLVMFKLESLRSVFMNGQAMPYLQSLIISGCKQLKWQSLLIVIRSLTLLKHLQFKEMPKKFALAFFPFDYSKTMRSCIQQEYYEEVMKRKPEVYFIWWNKDHWAQYDLSYPCYKVIEQCVMRYYEVLPKVL